MRAHTHAHNHNHDDDDNCCSEHQLYSNCCRFSAADWLPLMCWRIFLVSYDPTWPDTAVEKGLWRIDSVSWMPPPLAPPPCRCRHSSFVFLSCYAAKQSVATAVHCPAPTPQTCRPKSVGGAAHLSQLQLFAAARLRAPQWRVVWSFCLSPAHGFSKV